MLNFEVPLYICTLVPGFTKVSKGTTVPYMPSGSVRECSGNPFPTRPPLHQELDLHSSVQNSKKKIYLKTGIGFWNAGGRYKDIEGMTPEKA